MFKQYLSLKYNQLVLGSLLVVFIAPFVAAHLLYGMRNTFNFKTVEKGTFLSPPIPTNSFSCFDPAWLKKWQIIYVTSSSEPASYQTMMSQLKQIHSALGKDNHRVEYRSIPIQKTTLLDSEKIVIVDPRGWLIMYYAVNTDPQWVLKDMKRLLKYSYES